MPPSRGLKPALLAPSFKSQSLAIRCNASRKFSSGPCRNALSHARANALRPSGSRTGLPDGAVAYPSLTTARNFSWNPFGSSKPVDIDLKAVQPPRPAPPVESVVTTKTPELAPETLNSAAVTDAAANTVTNTAANTATNTAVNTAPNTASSSGGSSWYNPLSWGSKSQPAPAPDTAAPTSTPEPPAPVTESVVATTPEAAPTPAADSAAPTQTIDGILESATGMIQYPDGKIGYLKEGLGLDFGWGPTAINEWILEHIHVYSGLGWGLSIIGTTLAIRLLLLKPMLYTSDNAAKMACLTPVLAPLRKKSMETSATPSGGNAAKMVRQQISHVYAQAGISNWKGMIAPIVSGIFGYGTFRLLRSMATVPVPGLLDAGWAWFSDLTVSDPYYIFPLAIGITMHMTARFRPETVTQQTISPIVNVLILYGLPVFIFAVSAWLPAALQVSFLTSNLWSLGQQTVLSYEGNRRLLGLTPFPTQESLQFFERVNKGEITIRHALVLLQQAKEAPASTVKAQRTVIPGTATSQTMKYEAPTVKSSISFTTPRSDKPLNLRPGAKTPSHIVSSKLSNTTVTGIEEEPIPEGFKAKVSWFLRSMKWRNLKPRLLAWYSAKTGIDTASKLANERKRLAKKKADEYEWRRKEALKYK